MSLPRVTPERQPSPPTWRMAGSATRCRGMSFSARSMLLSCRRRTAQRGGIHVLTSCSAFCSRTMSRQAGSAPLVTPPIPRLPCTGAPHCRQGVEHLGTTSDRLPPGGRRCRPPGSRGGSPPWGSAAAPPPPSTCPAAAPCPPCMCGPASQGDRCVATHLSLHVCMGPAWWLTRPPPPPGPTGQFKSAYSACPPTPTPNSSSLGHSLQSSHQRFRVWPPHLWVGTAPVPKRCRPK